MFSLVLDEKQAAKRYSLLSGETIVGRSPGCDVVINDPSVSRRQARIVISGSECTLFDLESTNGTFVNGEPAKERVVRDGDALLFGSVTATMEASAEDRVTLSDNHELVDWSGTVIRPAAGRSTPRSERGPAVDARRLLAMMSQISHALVTPQPLLTVLNGVVDLAFSAIHAERAFLMLNDERSGTVVPKVARKRNGSPLSHTSVSRTVINRVMAERVMVLAKDAQTDARMAGAQSLIDAKVRSFMCAPLWDQNDVIGVFTSTTRTRVSSAAKTSICSARFRTMPRSRSNRPV